MTLNIDKSETEKTDKELKEMFDVCTSFIISKETSSFPINEQSKVSILIHDPSKLDPMRKRYERIVFYSINLEPLKTVQEMNMN